MRWLFELKTEILPFLEQLKSSKRRGFFRYSLMNDIYSDDIKWGLGNTVFAVKTYFILNSLKEMTENEINSIVNFIRGFQTKGGAISDSLITKRTALRNKIASIKNFNFSNFFGQKTIIAETRQAIVALMLLGKTPYTPFLYIPYNQRAIANYFKYLNWRNIWAAASHINHLIFFYTINSKYFNFKKRESEELIRYCLDRICMLQDKNEGIWFKFDTNPRQKVNAAMKIISAFNIIKKNIEKADRIIDFILDVPEEYYYDGCDNLNAIFVLKYAFDSTDKSYRSKDVYSYCHRSLQRYKNYFFHREGGFSFYPHAAPRRYYGLKVTNKFLGPDIHGTMLFTWALSLIASILDINKQNFQEVIN